MKKSIYTVDQIDALLSGKGMAFLGQFATVEEIVDPVEGGHYLVGSAIPYDVYTYISGVWVNSGPFQGPQGEKGDPFTYEDFTPEQLEALEGGAKAAQKAAEDAAKSAGESKDAAKTSETNAANSAVAAKSAADRVNPEETNARIDSKGDNLEFDTEEGLLYLTSGGERISDGIKVATSGGGGSGNVSSDDISRIRVLDLAEYNEINPKDSETLYFVRG